MVHLRSFASRLSARLGARLGLRLVAFSAGALAALGASGCKDSAKESAAHAARDAALLADLIDKDVGEVERGLPAGALKLAGLVADGADPRQDIAGVRRALVRVRREVVDLNIAKSTFFALADPGGVAIRNDLEEDAMAGQDLVPLFPALARATSGYVSGTGTFPTVAPAPKTAPDRDWIAGAPVKRADGTTGAILVTGWSYRYFARHLQESLKTHLLDEAKSAGDDGKIPVFYVAVFDAAGVYAAPLTPDVDTAALADQGLAPRTASGPAQGTVSIADRMFGFAAQRTPKLGPDTGVVVLRSE